MDFENPKSSRTFFFPFAFHSFLDVDIHILDIQAVYGIFVSKKAVYGLLDSIGAKLWISKY